MCVCGVCVVCVCVVTGNPLYAHALLPALPPVIIYRDATNSDTWGGERCPV